MSGTYVSERAEVDPLRVRYFSRALSGPSAGVETPQGNHGGYGRQRSLERVVSFRTHGREGDSEVTATSGAEFIQQLKESGDIANPSYDIGHPFWKQTITRSCGFRLENGEKEYIMYSPPAGSPARETVRNLIETSNQYYVAGAWRRTEGVPDPSWFITTNDNASGKAAINAAAPTRPVANSAVFIGELFAGLPTVIGATLFRDRIGVLRALGSEYLNVQFGWLPLIADIRKTIEALSNASAILTNYAKDSGRNVRRRYTLPDLTYSQFFNAAGGNTSAGSASLWTGYRPDGMPTGGSGLGGQAPSVDGSTLVVSVSAKQERWFTGAFTYYVPPGGSFLKDLARFEALSNKLLGTRLTPEVLWNLAPWTWLVDWIVRLGDHISLYTRFQDDGLVLRYGYLMVRDRVTVSSNFSTFYTRGPGVNRKGHHFTLVKLDRKRRVRATPFGFGLNPTSDFTARQWSILGALGMTRSPRSLRGF